MGLKRIWAAPLFASLLMCQAEPQVFPFEDAEGRQCRRVCEDNGCSFSCTADAAPSNGCGEGSEPAFVVDGGGAEQPAALCDGCSSAIGTAYDQADCVHLVCTQDDDCGFGNLRCQDGACWNK
jgi:hypothetical protein